MLILVIATGWRARGLATAQLGALKKKFLPRPQPPAALKEDFRKWLKEMRPN